MTENNIDLKIILEYHNDTNYDKLHYNLHNDIMIFEFRSIFRNSKLNYKCNEVILPKSIIKNIQIDDFDNILNKVMQFTFNDVNDTNIELHTKIQEMNEKTIFVILDKIDDVKKYDLNKFEFICNFLKKYHGHIYFFF